MKVVYMGTPDFAVKPLEALIENNYEVVGVFTQPDKPVGRKAILTPPPVKVVAENNNIPVFQPIKIREEFQEIIDKESDFLVQYFMDTWGSAYVESAQEYFGKKMLEDLKKENMSRTHLWSPGQYGFELKNQNTMLKMKNYSLN